MAEISKSTEEGGSSSATPNSRELALSMSREKLARALSRLDRLCRDAAETISDLKLEKLELEQRIESLMQRSELERQNFEQRDALLQSVQSESEERMRLLDAAQAQKHVQEYEITSLQGVISNLETQLEAERHERSQAQTARATSETELANWQDKYGESSERLEWVTKERDHFRSLIVDREREDAQWALKLTSDDQKKVAKSVDEILDAISTMESRISNSEQ